MKKHIINEEWIKLENDLAEELLKADKKERASKYTDVYEKMLLSIFNFKFFDNSLVFCPPINLYITLKGIFIAIFIF